MDTLAVWQVVITDPDMVNNRGATISLDLTSGSGRIQVHRKQDPIYVFPE
jgi:hypothetical protein